MSSSTEANQSTVSCVKEKCYLYGRNAVIAQCLATFIISLTYLGVGTLVVIPTVVVGNVLNSTNDALSFSEEDASWFGSIPFLIQPVGALIGIVLQDYFSQKYSLWLSNLFSLAFFITLYYAKDTTTALLSSTFMAISLGFTEPSGMGYISEYSEARLRGFLCSSTLVMMSVGTLYMYLVGALVAWRTALLICAILPTISILLLPWIPESPVWLLSKGKKKKALTALIWFRGWVRKEHVEEEYEDLDCFVRTSLTFGKSKDGGKESHQSNFVELLSSILEKRTLYPFFLLAVFQMTVLLGGSAGPKMYAVNLFKTLQIPMDPSWLTVTMGVAYTAGSLIVILALKYTGKRKFSVISIFFTSMISISLGAYIRYKDELQLPWLFIILFATLSLGSCQAASIPWIMMGEIFPVRTRHVGTGIAGAFFDVSIFFCIKTYFMSDRLLGTELLFVVNGLAGLVGCLFLYLYLPETEGKSLAEIENIFIKKCGNKK